MKTELRPSFTAIKRKFDKFEDNFDKRFNQLEARKREQNKGIIAIIEQMLKK